ncbi:hypothetical protein [Amycolatopsis thermoflava]|uniref:hypothetical protein n=1 Tax=Amycolatopsis thermoflava TaxID=84480 RepID=UPI00365F73F8
MTEVTPDEQAPLSDASLARLAVAAAAQDLADFARAFVSISGTRHSSGGELEDGQKLVAKAEYVLERLVVFERVAGPRWEDIGSGLSVARQNAHKKFRSAVEGFEQALGEPEVTNPNTGVTYNQLPEGADDPAWWADRLDAWVRRHREPTEYEIGDSERPVSGGLARLGPLAATGGGAAVHRRTRARALRAAGRPRLHHGGGERRAHFAAVSRNCAGRSPATGTSCPARPKPARQRRRRPTSTSPGRDRAREVFRAFADAIDKAGAHSESDLLQRRANQLMAGWITQLQQHAGVDLTGSERLRGETGTAVAITVGEIELTETPRPAHSVASASPGEDQEPLGSSRCEVRDVRWRPAGQSTCPVVPRLSEVHRFSHASRWRQPS